MMKKLFICISFIICAFCIISCASENNTDTLSEDDDKSTDVETTVMHEDTTFFDENYVVIMQLIELKDYEQAYKKIVDIDNKKLAEELMSKFVVIEDVLLSKTLNIPEDKFGNNKGPYTIEFSYDEKGNLSNMNATSIPHTLGIHRSVVNHFIKNIYADADYVAQYEDFIYDDNNKLAKIIGYWGESDKIYYTVEFIYDEQGVNKEIIYKSSQNTITTHLEYNNNNQLVRVWRYDGKNLYEKFINYDEKGNMVEEGTVYGNTGKITESTFNCRVNGILLEGKCVWNYGTLYIYKE